MYNYVAQNYGVVEMKLSSSKWIEAAKILANNPNLKILCPECNQQNLKVLDVINEIDPYASERYLLCDGCGARNILRLQLPR
jgi:uncharacterized protein with PIN domain